MAIIAYLNFVGNTAEVIDFYEEALDATEIKTFTFKDFPQDPHYPIPAEELELIMNASMKFAGGIIMLSDVLPSMKEMADSFIAGNNVTLSVVLKEKADIKKYFDKLSVGGTVTMPLAQTPWSESYGMLVDKFGIGWQFNCTSDEYYYTN